MNRGAVRSVGDCVQVGASRNEPPAHETDRTLHQGLLRGRTGIAEVRVDSELPVMDVLDAVVECAGMSARRSHGFSHRGRDRRGAPVSDHRTGKEPTSFLRHDERTCFRLEPPRRGEEVAFGVHEARVVRPVFERFPVRYPRTRRKERVATLLDAPGAQILAVLIPVAVQPFVYRARADAGRAPFALHTSRNLVGGAQMLEL